MSGTIEGSIDKNPQEDERELFEDETPLERQVREEVVAVLKRSLSEKHGAQADLSREFGMAQRQFNQMLRGNWLPTIKWWSDPLRQEVYFKTTGRYPDEVSARSLVEHISDLPRSKRREFAEYIRGDSSKEPDMNPEEVTQRHELERLVGDVLATLDPNDQEIIKKRFGLGGEHEMSREELRGTTGADSKQPARQLENTALFRFYRAFDRKLEERRGHKKYRTKIPPFKTERPYPRSYKFGRR